MKLQEDVFWETIDIFAEVGLLPYVVLVGSWVEFIYEKAFFRKFEASLHTMDIDFLVKNLRLPRKKMNVIKILEENDYIADVDSITGVTRFYKEGIIEIQFLVRELGTGKTEPYLVEQLGIKAEGLRYMNLLADNSVRVKVKGYEIAVPKPAAYILEKLLVNENRGTKREKDIRAVQRILDAIQESHDALIELNGLYKSLSPKQRKKIGQVCNENGILLFSDLK